MFANKIAFLGLFWKSVLLFGAQAKSLIGIIITGRFEVVSVGLFLGFLRFSVFKGAFSS
jgi:hypothetical protein